MEITVLTGLLSVISEITVSTDEITCFCKNPKQILLNTIYYYGIRKSFLLQATFTRDIVEIFKKKNLQAGVKVEISWTHLDILI